MCVVEFIIESSNDHEFTDHDNSLQRAGCSDAALALTAGTAPTAKAADAALVATPAPTWLASWTAPLEGLLPHRQGRLAPAGECLGPR